MTRLQQVLFELDGPYLGHPYYVSGNALLHALGTRVPVEDAAELNASHGVFVPGEFGRFPEAHSADGYRPTSGRRCRPSRRTTTCSSSGVPTIAGCSTAGPATR